MDLKNREKIKNLEFPARVMTIRFIRHTRARIKRDDVLARARAQPYIASRERGAHLLEMHTRSRFHLHIGHSVSVTYPRFTTCCASKCEGRKSARSPGHQDRDGISPSRLGQLRDRWRTIRAAGVYPELYLCHRVRVERVLHRECIELTNVREIVP